MSDPALTKHPYVIINDIDRPEPSMVCQWVPSVGYCYLDRRDSKPRFDGMQSGFETTSVEDFGIVWANNKDGTVSFYKSDRPCVARYADGAPRKWQSDEVSFEFKRLRKKTLTLAVTP